MKFITTILSAFFCLSIQAQLVTYPGYTEYRDAAQ